MALTPSCKGLGVDLEDKTNHIRPISYKGLHMLESQVGLDKSPYVEQL